MGKVELSNKLRKEYTELFSSCKIKSEKVKITEDIIRKIFDNKQKYDSVSIKLNIPWYFIAVIHNMESSLNFRTHLHNGDPLTGRTKHVPSGRPAAGSPPFTWEESAVDALTLKKLDKWTDWDIAGILYKLEEYNGFGYRMKHPNVLSPYLWSFTNHYNKGKYVADGTFDNSAVSQQCGAAALLKKMQNNKLIAVAEKILPEEIKGIDINEHEYPGRVIKKGDKDKAAVLLIQKMINIKGCGPIDEDGDFGPQTYKAVKLFQARFTDQEQRPLKIDGEVGSITWAALFNTAAVPQEEKPKSALLKKVLETAKNEIGVREVPEGSNWGPKVQEYLESVNIDFPAFWCAAFVYWCFKISSGKLGKKNPVYKTAGVLDHWNNAECRKITKSDAADNPAIIEPGSIFIISTGGGGGHTGIVESINGGYLSTIEGNTNEAGSRNGIGVFRRQRKITEINRGYLIYS